MLALVGEIVGMNINLQSNFIIEAATKAYELGGMGDALAAAFALADMEPRETIRDHFAGQAIASMTQDSDDFASIAKRAYQIADAMIEARRDNKIR